MPIRPHFLARITLRDPANGGRTKPANLAVYRPDIRFSFDDEGQYGAHFPHTAGLLEPGETKDLEVQLRVASVMRRVTPGLTFLLVEGDRVVADGEVLDVRRIDS